jgi:hypothetical protein
MQHRILRVVTSHSLVPAWVYRKIVPLEQDWFYLTDIKNNFISEWSKEDDYIRLEDEYNRVLVYEKGLYKLFYKNRLIKEFGEKKEDVTPVEVKPTINLKYKKRIKEPKIIIDGKPFILKDEKLTPAYIIKPIKYRTNIDLYHIYRKLDNQNIESIDLNYYALIKNELIRRKQIPGEIISPNKYNTNFDPGANYDY